MSLRRLISVSGRALHGLLLASLLVGPSGAGAAIISFATGGAEVACPCDEANHADAATPCDDGVCDTNAEAPPCGMDETDSCPDNCPHCLCSPGVLGAIIVFIPHFPAPMHPVCEVTVTELPVQAIFSGTFRPPQSRL